MFITDNDYCSISTQERNSLANQTLFPPVADLPANANLPDAFTMFDGTLVATPEQWMQQRRPELKMLFQNYMYGFMPPPPGISTDIRKFDATVFGGKATLKEIEIRFAGLSDDAPKINLALFIPNHVQEPAPVFLALNHTGNYAVSMHPDVTFDSHAWVAEDWKQRVTRGIHADFWAVENTIDRGYAFATFHESDIDPDQHDFDDGIHPCYDPGVPNHARWGTLAAWAARMTGQRETRVG